MGPSLDLSMRRQQPAGQDLQREAMRQPKTAKKKVGGSGSFTSLTGHTLGPVMVPSPWRSAVPPIRGVATPAECGSS